MNRMDDLYQKVAKDSKLQERLKEILNNGKGEDERNLQRNLENFAKELGYDINYEELREYFQNFSKEKAAELADIELDMVAGGKFGHEGMFSIITLGLYCLIASVDREIKRETGCELDF
jgi:predicted ribosomally synthesized peptide with nif11-like leader